LEFSFQNTRLRIILYKILFKGRFLVLFHLKGFEFPIEQNSSHDVTCDHPTQVMLTHVFEDSLMLRRDDATIAIDELYVQLDASLFVNDNLPVEEHDTSSDDEEELCSSFGGLENLSNRFYFFTHTHIK
jgi:hypothetical protein